MQIKCEYCGSYIKEGDEFCSQCGAVNANFKRATDGTPKTIDELKAWYRAKNLPSEETTRFFIGKNYQGARAFGVYEENGEYIVYKNKDDGTRAVRYKGKDEAYAVNEIYLKLKSEILNQKAHNLNNHGGKKQSNFKSKLDKISGYVVIVAFCIFMLSTIFSFIKDTVNGAKDKPYAGNYYAYDNDVYYCDSYVYDRWYIYDFDEQDYLPAEIPQQMYDDIQSYRYADDEEWDSSLERFEDTEMGQYVESLKESSDSDSDSDYSWDSSDSWSSDSTDWDSDW